jgi:hypothetical protein
MFKLPDSWSACGSTGIVTIADLLAFGRTHLSDGVAPTGERVLSADLAQQMRMPAFDMGTPNVPPVGLGWWLVPFGNTSVLWHGGGSPGGTAALFVVPEHDLVFAAYGNAAGAAALHDRLFLWLLQDHLGVEVPSPVSETTDVDNLGRYEGTYRSHQLRWDVKAVDGRLEETPVFEPQDEAQARILGQFSGGQFPPPGRRLVPVREGLFAIEGTTLPALAGLGRLMLVSFHGDDGGHPTHRSHGARLPRRVA